MHPSPQRPVAVLGMPLPVEYEAVLSLLPGHTFTERTVRGTVFKLTELQGRHGAWTLALTMTGRQNEAAAVAVERAVAAFDPQVILLVGVAGGRRDAAVGDVIAATEVYGYEAGEDTDADYLSRIKTLQATHLLLQQAHQVDVEDAWRERLGPAGDGPRPRVHHRPIAAGSKVITGVRSGTAALIDRHCGDAQGIDMEGFGALAAAWRTGGVEAMVIRGVSDLLADKDKAADRHRQPRAARHAGAFALALVERLEPRGRPDGAPDGPAPEPEGARYIGAVGQGATAIIAAFGDGAHGTVNLDRATTDL
ncbi:phosphorylase [Glycomyces paridis]|uniref:5'-methylthioadenosine/S-adenosylhomocysteine nucleosidase family protein n=1 Tax=Glycomyces paridis TaxID=2126555 RepID=UPI0013053533|nr:phosphorylase [Glycomyces paridis]